MEDLFQRGWFLDARTNPLGLFQRLSLAKARDALEGCKLWGFILDGFDRDYVRECCLLCDAALYRHRYHCYRYGRSVGVAQQSMAPLSQGDCGRRSLSHEHCDPGFHHTDVYDGIDRGAGAAPNEVIPVPPNSAVHDNIAEQSRCTVSVSLTPWEEG